MTSVRINPQASSLIVEYTHHDVIIIQDKIFYTIQQADSIVDVTEIKEKDHNEVDLVERLGLPAAGLVLSLAALVGLPIPPVILGATVLIAAIPVFGRAWSAIQQEQQLTIDFLDGLAISLHTLQGNFASELLF